MSTYDSFYKLKFRGNKKTAVLAVFICALLATSAVALAPLASAKNVYVTIPTWAYLTAYPAQVSVGQTIYLAMWIDKVTPTAAGIAGGDLWGNFTITVTLPDNSTAKLGPYTADNAGGAAATYVPQKQGNYTFVFNFPGMTITGNANTGVPAHPNPATTPSIGDVYGGSTSAPSTVSVGSTPAYTISENPLPTGYWQNPVEAFNHQWYTIEGDWLGMAANTFASTGAYGYAGDNNPYTQPVTSAHILWTKPEAYGGQIGAESNGGANPIVGGGNESSPYYTGAEYQPKFSPIVMDGVLYYTNYPSSTGSVNGWTAVNIRTGQVLWTKNTTDILICGQVYNYKSINYYGAWPYLWAQRVGSGAAITGSPTSNKLDMFDAMTGAYVLTVNMIIGGTKILGSEGSILEYYINTTTVTTTVNSTTVLKQYALANTVKVGPALNAPGVTYSVGSTAATPYASSYTYTIASSNTANLPAGQTVNRTSSLVLWNSSLCINPTINSFYSNPQNANYTYARGIEWSVNLPQAYNGNPFYYPGAGWSSFGIRTIDQPDQMIVLYVSPGNLSSSPWEVEAGYTMGGTLDGVSGAAKQVWMVNNTITPYTTVFAGPSGDGIFTETDKELLENFAYNILTGKQVWTSFYNGNPLGYYDQNTAIYSNGQLFEWTFGGYVYDFNMTTGKTIWTWNDGSAGENTPYGVNPLWCISAGSGTIAGGMMYVETGHNYGPPLFSGAQVYAINATTGKLAWSFLDFASTSVPCVVEGELLTFNSYDLQIYAQGKGLTQTTVDTKAGINTNSQVLVTGTVTDQSPGQTCLGIPEKGTPAIADSSMSAWMAYLFEQSPEPTNATGVPVTLSYIDPNNNTYPIGTTTSNMNGVYTYKFTPTIAGTYTIIATFGGSNSYYSSTAETTMLWNTPTSATAAPTATPTSVADTYFVPAIAGLFVLIVVVAIVLAMLMLRKKP